MNPSIPNSRMSEQMIYIERGYLDDVNGELAPAAQRWLIPSAQQLTFAHVHSVTTAFDLQGAKTPAAPSLEALTIGMFGARCPLLYAVVGEPRGISVYLSSSHFAASHQHSADNEVPLKTLTRALQGSAPGIGVQEVPYSALLPQLARLKYAGLLVGTPTIVRGKAVERAGIDRLIRGMHGTHWAYLVVARPMEPAETARLQTEILRELRQLVQEEDSTKKRPLEQAYGERLHLLLKKLTDGKATGLWHTSVYILCEHQASFKQAQALLAALFGGARSRPDAIRVLGCHQSAALIRQFAQPGDTDISPNGQFHYPYRYMSLCTGRELAAFVQLPNEETPGYRVIPEVRFDVAPHIEANDTTIAIGQIIDRGQRSALSYVMPLKDFTRHVLVSGTTGSGKTNSVFRFLKEFYQRGIPFLIIEPAKAEYRALAQSAIGASLQVFTVGNETVAPLRFNPFQILPGVHPQTHIDYLNAVFSASFVMYAPMPQVMERCIHEIYEDRGWNLVTGSNECGSREESDIYPTLTDLYRKIDPVVESLKYESRVEMDVKAALKTRINSLRIGGKGLMLDTRESLPFHVLLQRPTVIELDQMGNDDEKAFVMGLLLTFLAEFRTVEGAIESGNLRHVTVVEEAHRLLSYVPPAVNADIANPRGKAVDTFCTMLAEVRAYGQGFMIVEQIPSKLAPDVIKNTVLKITHRLPAADDGAVVGGTMSLDAQQVRRLSSLATGEAAVYGAHDDGALLVAVLYEKIATPISSRAGQDDQIRRLMLPRLAELGQLYMPSGYPLVQPESAARYRWEALQAIERPALRERVERFMLSTALNPEAWIAEFNELAAFVARDRGRDQAKWGYLATVLGYSLADVFERWRRHYGWQYAQTRALRSLLVQLIHEVARPRFQPSGSVQPLSQAELGALQAFQQGLLAVCRVPAYPFAGCEHICAGKVCLYRQQAARLAREPELSARFNEIAARWQQSDQNSDAVWKALAELCGGIPVERTVGSHIPLEERRRAALCYALHRFDALPNLSPAKQAEQMASMRAVVQQQMK